MNRAAVHLQLVGMVVLWGVSWPAGRVLAQSMPAFSGSAWRFSIACAVMLAWLRLSAGAWPRLSVRQWAGLAAAGAVGVFAYSAFFMLSLQRVEASRAAVVVTTNPVFTTLLAAWWFKERFNAWVGLGLALAVVGAATVMTHGAPWKVLAADVGTGEWLLLGCIATWTTYSLMGKRLMAGIDALAATTITASVGCVLMWVAALMLEGPAVAVQSIAALSPRGWAALLYMAIGATVLSYAWFNRGIAVLGAGVASSYISLVPVLGVASSVLMLGEPLEASLLAGGTLALTGVVLANRARR